MNPPTTQSGAGSTVLDGDGWLQANVLTLFLQLLPATFISETLAKAKIREYRRVYNSLVVMWLMIWQRLQEKGTMRTAVLEAVRGLPTTFWPEPCKRLEAARKGGRRLSNNTGAYNQARQTLSQAVVEPCYDRIFDQLMVAVKTGEPTQRPAFFLDGTSLRTPHREELVAQYPPAVNQHGNAHWPVIRMLVAHDLYTGLGMRPEWGPMYGEEAVSEQGLLESAIHRLPPQALVVADANFGVFSVAFTAGQQEHPVILRLTSVRARYLSGGQLRDGMDQRVVWKPSRDDRRSHPQLAADASVEGRLIVRQVRPDNGAEPFLLAIFTTQPDTPEKIFDSYGYRWNIEVDLRSLKSTLRLEDLACTTPEMVAKEIELAMMTYNLVRAVMYQVAQRTGLKPRAFSFTDVRNVLNTFLPEIARANNEEQAQKLTEDMLYYLTRCQLPKRRRKQASSPRSVWRKPKAYPARHVPTPKHVTD